MKILSEAYKLYREYHVFEALYQTLLEMNQSEEIPFSLVAAAVHKYDEVVLNIIKSSTDCFAIKTQRGKDKNGDPCKLGGLAVYRGADNHWWVVLNNVTVYRIPHINYNVHLKNRKIKQHKIVARCATVKLWAYSPLDEKTPYELVDTPDVAANPYTLQVDVKRKEKRKPIFVEEKPRGYNPLVHVKALGKGEGVKKEGGGCSQDFTNPMPYNEKLKRAKDEEDFRMIARSQEGIVDVLKGRYRKQATPWPRVTIKRCGPFKKPVDFEPLLKHENKRERRNREVKKAKKWVTREYLCKMDRQARRLAEFAGRAGGSLHLPGHNVLVEAEKESEECVYETRRKEKLGGIVVAVTQKLNKWKVLPVVDSSDEEDTDEELSNDEDGNDEYKSEEQSGEEQSNDEQLEEKSSFEEKTSSEESKETDGKILLWRDETSRENYKKQAKIRNRDPEYVAKRKEQEVLSFLEDLKTDIEDLKTDHSIMESSHDLSRMTDRDSHDISHATEFNHDISHATEFNNHELSHATEYVSHELSQATEYVSHDLSCATDCNADLFNSTHLENDFKNVSIKSELLNLSPISSAVFSNKSEDTHFMFNDCVIAEDKSSDIHEAVGRVNIDDLDEVGNLGLDEAMSVENPFAINSLKLPSTPKRREGNNPRSAINTPMPSPDNSYLQNQESPTFSRNVARKKLLDHNRVSVENPFYVPPQASPKYRMKKNTNEKAPIPFNLPSPQKIDTSFTSSNENGDTSQQSPPKPLKENFAIEDDQLDYEWDGDDKSSSEDEIHSPMGSSNESHEISSLSGNISPKPNIHAKIATESSSINPFIQVNHEDNLSNTQQVAKAVPRNPFGAFSLKHSLKPSESKPKAHLTNPFQSEQSGSKPKTHSRNPFQNNQSESKPINPFQRRSKQTSAMRSCVYVGNFAPHNAQYDSRPEPAVLTPSASIEEMAVSNQGYTASNQFSDLSGLLNASQSQELDQSFKLDLFSCSTASDGQRSPK